MDINASQPAVGHLIIITERTRRFQRRPLQQVMSKMNTIAFFGLGLIGGSIAKAIRKNDPSIHLIAYDWDRDTLAQALTLGVIDGVCEEEDQRLVTADYLFLCAPVDYNIQYLEKISGRIGDNCIVTDVGSVKGNIHEKVAELNLQSHFIGGHPMAGSERIGFISSNERILENAYYIITPGGEVPINRITEFTDLIRLMGAIPMVITAEEHDFITAGVSHLPHIIASSLVNLVSMLDNEAEYMKTIAAGGFRDITRIASSSPVMWQQICLENKDNISNVLDDYIRILVQFKYYVDNKDAENLFNLFAASRDYRDSIDVKGNGLLTKSYILYIDIADEAGGIAQVTTILALDDISIRNIGIIHNREFERGVLKLEFYGEDAMKRAIELLKKRNYMVYER